MDVAVGVRGARLGEQELTAHAQVDAERGVATHELHHDPLAVAAHRADPSSDQSGDRGRIGVADGARVGHRQRGQLPTAGDLVELGCGDRDLGRLGHQPSSSSSGSISSPAAARALARPTARA